MLTPKYDKHEGLALDGWASEAEKATDLVNQLIHTLTPGLPEQVTFKSLNIRKHTNGEMEITANLKLVKFIGGFGN